MIGAASLGLSTSGFQTYKQEIHASILNVWRFNADCQRRFAFTSVSRFFLDLLGFELEAKGCGMLAGKEPAVDGATAKL